MARPLKQKTLKTCHILHFFRFFLAQFKKMLYICSRKSSAGVRGWEVSPSRKAKLLTKHPSHGFQDIFKRRLLTLCSGLMKCRSFELMFQDLATVDVLRDIDYPSCAYFGTSFAYMCIRTRVP